MHPGSDSEGAAILPQAPGGDHGRISVRGLAMPSEGRRVVHDEAAKDHDLVIWIGTVVCGVPVTERPSAVTKRASFPSAWGEKKPTTSPS